VWRKGEVVRLVKTAWRNGYKGLAACMAVAWDSQLSPIDARTLKASQLQRDPVGVYFKVERAKTGRGALGTLTRRAKRVLVALMQEFGADLVGEAAIFRNRSRAAYSKDTLGDNFRDIRELVFGPAEKRQMADFRRTSTVEALAGGFDPETLSNKMANTLSQSNFLPNTCTGPARARPGSRHCTEARTDQTEGTIEGQKCSQRRPKVSPQNSMTS
jgi:hypothetical protein